MKCPNCGADIEVISKQRLKLVKPPETKVNPKKGKGRIEMVAPPTKPKTKKAKAKAKK